MNNCIFCKIIKKEIPATIIFEDQDLLAFMDINPIIKGHALIIPKNHHETILDTPDNILSKIQSLAKKIAEKQMNNLGADGVNIIQNNGVASGQEVPHIHVHIIPRFSNDGHCWNWRPKQYEDLSEMTVLAEQIKID